MQCYSELVPPTAVTHSLHLSLVSPKSNNLVVAKHSLLQIFTTTQIAAELDPSNQTPNPADPSTSQYKPLANDEDLEASFLGGDAPLTKMDKTIHTKLVLLAEYPLPGTITGLARIKTRRSKSGGEMLLASLKDAKIALVEWDPVACSLATVSIHYYEQEELLGSPWAPPLGVCRSFLVADPGSRCAALRFGVRNLAILPFNWGDEDVDMDGWDEELDGPKPQAAATATNGTDNNNSGDSVDDNTPYSSSFVLRLPNLDPHLIHPVHLAFLFEYREPTFGILTSTMTASPQLGRRDHLSYMVFTLDLQQKASTTILSVLNLPQDLFKVIPLPAPVGGALLVGANELIHVDQSGKTNGVAVNSFTKQQTSFGLVDQSSLNLKLEDSRIEMLSAENGEMLMVLNGGRTAVIKFQIDGRTVSGVHIHMVPVEAGGSIIPYTVSTLTKLGRSSMFVGSEDSDSHVLGWTRKQAQLSKRTRTLDVDLDLSDDEEFDEDDYDDDLYGEAPAQIQPSALASSSQAGDITFKIHDKLVSIAPIRAAVPGKASFVKDSEEANHSKGVSSPLQLVAAVGSGSASAIAVMNREINPKVVGKFTFPEARDFWTMRVRKPVPKALQGEKGTSVVGNDYSLQFDKFMIVSKVDLDGYHTSDVYALTAAGFEALTGTEFEPAAGFTVEAGTMGNDNRIIQVLKSEIRCYDGDLGLSQILPMQDEDTGADPRAVSASIEDPFLLVVRDDHSVYVASIDKHNEIEEIDIPDEIASTKWISGCLYKDNSGIFIPDAPAGKNVVMFLLSHKGDLSMYTLPDFGHIWTRSDVCYVPQFLGGDFAVRRGQAKEALTELLVAELGDAVDLSPHLIVRNAKDDLTVYKPWRVTRNGKVAVEFQKVANAILARAPGPLPKSGGIIAETEQFLPMRPCRDVGGYACVFLPGHSPSFLLKSAKSIPRVLPVRGSHIRGMSPFHTEGCEHGFITTDIHGVARVCQLPPNTSFAELGIAVQKIPLGGGGEITSLTFHAPTKTYMVACSSWEDFELPKDKDGHRDWSKEASPLALPPKVERSTIKLVDAVTWKVVQSIQCEPCEVVLCMETLNLEVSEESHERRQLVCVGTAISRGEDLPVRGRICVYDVVAVIPQPGRPETDRGIKLIAREDIPRGAVTALSEVGTQGLMLVAQGQKCMVRGLKEDGTLLPVAFMDMSCYITSAKELRGTGLCVMADAFKGVWFTGYSEEPYRMTLFGKSAGKMEVTCADFLPDGKDLFVVAGDGEGGVNVLQFDPEHPKTLQGHLLLHITTFEAGAHVPTIMRLLPKTGSLTLPAQAREDGDEGDEGGSSALLVVAGGTGLISLLTTLDESQYRRLSSLTAQLNTNLAHPLGLNPKGYRMPGSTGQGGPPPAVDAGVGRSIVDGVLLGRWNELGSGRRAEVAGRAGFNGTEEVRGVLGGVGWGGIGYF